MKTKLVGSFEVHLTKEACGKDLCDETRIAHVTLRGKDAIVMDLDDKYAGKFDLSKVSFEELLNRMESGSGTLEKDNLRPLGGDDVNWVNIWVVLSNKKGQSIIQEGLSLLEKVQKIVRG